MSKWFSILAMSVMAFPASATVTNVGLVWFADYDQTSDAEPADTLGTFFLSSLSATTDGDLLAAQLTNPLGTVMDFYDASYNAGTYFQTYSPTYSSIADLVANYPGGNHTFDLIAGGAAPDTLSINVDEPDFPDTIPHLNGGTFSAMQAWPSGTDAPISWPAFSHAGTAPYLSTYFYLFDYTLDTLPFNDSTPEWGVGTTVPAAEMISGHYYGYVLVYDCSFSYPNSGFVNATTTAASERRASGILHCKSDPGTVAGKLVLGDHYYPSGKVVTVQVVAADGTVEDTQNVTVGAIGYYAFDTASRGVKTIKFKGTHWLTRAVADVDLDAGADTVGPELINGDIDGDDSITVFDYDRLSQAFDARPSDANWDADADLDGDSEVTVFDYDILSRNFDLSGDY